MVWLSSVEFGAVLDSTDKIVIPGAVDVGPGRLVAENPKIVGAGVELAARALRDALELALEMLLECRHPCINADSHTRA
jgi:hypothetical protein